MNIGTQVLMHLGAAHTSDRGCVGWVTYVHEDGRVNVSGFKENGAIFAHMGVRFVDGKEKPTVGAYAYPYNPSLTIEPPPKEVPPLPVKQGATAQDAVKVSPPAANTPVLTSTTIEAAK